MGTNAHTPDPAKLSHAAASRHAHDERPHALGPGVRPGVPSRLLEARRRLERRGLL